MIICNGINFKWYFNGAASAVFTREEERLSDTTTADPLWHSSARIWYKVSQETSKKAWDALQILIKQSCYALLVEVTLCSFYCILMKLKRRPLGLITYFFKICLKQQPYNWMFEQETSLKHNVKKGHKPTRWRTRARHETGEEIKVLQNQKHSSCQSVSVNSRDIDDRVCVGGWKTLQHLTCLEGRESRRQTQQALPRGLSLHL